MKQTGVVIEGGIKTAKVLIQRHPICGDCGACKMGAEDAKLEVEAINDLGARIGQWVEVDMDENTLLQATFIAYGIPLIALLLGIILGAQLLTVLGLTNHYEIYTALIGFALMSIAFLVIKSKETIIQGKKKYMPTITKITKDKEEV